MVSYKIQLTRSAEKDIFNLDKDLVARLWPKIKSLAITPYPKGSLKLSGTEDTYRIRVGKYWVVYRIEGETVKVIGIKHRKEAYR